MDKGGNTSATIARPGDTSLDLDAKALGDFDLLAEGIMRVLTQGLNYKIPSVVMYDKDFSGLRIIKYWLPKSIESIVDVTLGKSIDRLVFPLTASDNLFVKVYNSKTIEIRSSVEELCTPYLPRLISRQIDHILKMKMVAIVPIIIAQETIGTFAFGSDRSSDLSETERHFLTNMADQMGSYLVTTWALKNTITQNKLLAEQNTDLKNLLDIKQGLLKSFAAFIDTISPQLGSNDTKGKMKAYTNYMKSLCLLADSKTESQGNDEHNKSN